ncbi:MAG: hypothetical protein HKN34_06710, partial [Gammaproteobacteria bacterium]|nr:hypothetical protein [Gammaproteobacteria bacterium]
GITTTSFMIDGETIAVNDSTVIDNSIIEDSRGVELDIVDQPLGDIDEDLTELLVEGNIYVVVVDRSSGSPVAVEIED